MTSTTTNRGFSLLEIGVVIVIILILAAMLAPIMGGLVDVDRSTKASAELERIYRAIVGNPAAGNFGYLGDVGDYPTSLIDLVQDNGLDGWDGPYLTDVYVENGIVYDSLGSPIEYYHEAFDTGVNDLLAIISKGPDRVSTNLQENPNLSPWSALAGLLPTSAAYFMDSQNLDNLEYPRFSDNAGLARYNSVGTLDLNIFSYDSGLSRYMPGCPNLFEIRLTPMGRPDEKWGNDTEGSTIGSTPAYAPGGASFDLIQGSYRVQIRTTTTPHPIVWDEVVSISPGASQARTLYLEGVNSNTTPTYNLSVLNQNAFQLGILTTVGFEIASVPAGPDGASGSVPFNACSRVTIVNRTTKALVDSFIMPMAISTYSKNYDVVTYTYTLTNKLGVNKLAFVYRNDLLIGEVSEWGSKKIKTFGNMTLGDTITVKNRAGDGIGGTFIFGNEVEELN